MLWIRETYQKITIIILLCALTQLLKAQSINFFQKAGKWNNRNTDSLTFYAQKSIEKAKADRDTALLLKSMQLLASEYYFSGKYMNTFETNWEILSMIDQPATFGKWL